MSLTRLHLALLVALGSGVSNSALATPPQGGTATATAGAAPRPLTATERALFLSSGEDSPPAELGGTTDLLKGKHYVTSNELAVQRFEPHIRNLGGGYVGVGTDQSYLFIGWQRAELAWLFDYDPVVSDVHDLYLAFFGVAQNPEGFLHLWKRGSRQEALAVLAKVYTGDVLKRAHAAYAAYRAQIERRLLTTVKEQRALHVDSYLTTQAQYDYVAQLVRAGRVRRMVGDLVADRGLVGIAGVAAKLGVPVRTLYMSNAEEYFRQSGYGEQFRTNARAVLTDPRALVLRTLSTYPENKDYTYAAQLGSNFLAWLSRPWLRNVFQVAPRKSRTPAEVAADRYPMIMLDGDPDTSPAAKLASRDLTTKGPQK
jgi:hypothetical protein